MSDYKRPKPPSEAQLKTQCERWNERHPIGTVVRYYPVKGRPIYREQTTASAAQVLSGHTAVIWLSGERGCVSLDHCEVVEISADNREKQS